MHTDNSPADRAQRQYSCIASVLLCLTSLCCCCAPAASQTVTEPSAVRLVPSVADLSGTPFNEVRLCAPFSILVAPGSYGISIMAEPQVLPHSICRQATRFRCCSICAKHACKQRS